MGAYAVKQDMIDRFGEAELIQLTDRADPPAGAIDDTVLDRAFDDADGQIDAALNGRYALPLASVPKVLVRVACNLTRYYLQRDGASDEVKDRYKDEIDFLAGVSRGLNTLGIDAANASVSPAAGSVEFGDSRRVFGADLDGAREFG